MKKLIHMGYMKENSYPFFTIGHSTRTINEFIEILLEEKITLVVDVRTLPGSNKNPQYNKETLIKSLKPYKISYNHLAKLGGLRKNDLKVDKNINNFWINKSFKNRKN